MYLTTLLLTLLLGVTQAIDLNMVTTDATSFSAMLARGEAIVKRQGYTPEQRNCGRGNTCQEACGLSYVQCPSTDNRIHCHQPSTGTHCCSDGTGNACRAGYYCTTDGRGHTYCCPDGIQNAECARLYSLTISLIGESSLTALPSVPTVASSLPAVTPAFSSVSRVHVSTSSRMLNGTTPRSSSSPAPSSRAPTSVVLPSSTLNRISTGSSAASKTSSGIPAFTGAAVKIAGAGVAVVVGAVGFVL